MTAEEREELEADNARRKRRRLEEQERVEAEAKKPLFPSAKPEDLKRLHEQAMDDLVTQNSIIIFSQEARSCS